MKVSQYDVGILVTFQNFVQLTLYHQCGQYCNSFIYTY